MPALCSYFKGLCEQPAYVVFNGAEGSMTENARLVADQASGKWWRAVVMQAAARLRLGAAQLHQRGMGAAQSRDSGRARGRGPVLPASAGHALNTRAPCRTTS